MTNGAEKIVSLGDYQQLGVRREDTPWMPTFDGNDGTGGGDDGVIMEGRIGRLEAALEGLRHSQNILMAGVAIVAAVLIGLGVYQLQRLDQLNDKVADVPSKVSSDLRDITKTLAVSITAAKQQQPQVILLPAPQQQGSKPK